MIMLNEENAQRIATSYARSIGVGPFVVDGCELDETEEKPFWRVFLGFTDPAEVDVGLPDSLIVRVDALSGDASHTAML
jgi:hypothetical protein